MEPSSEKKPGFIWEQSKELTTPHEDLGKKTLRTHHSIVTKMYDMAKLLNENSNYRLTSEDEGSLRMMEVTLKELEEETKDAEEKKRIDDVGKIIHALRSINEQRLPRVESVNPPEPIVEPSVEVDFHTMKITDIKTKVGFSDLCRLIKERGLDPYVAASTNPIDRDKEIVLAFQQYGKNHAEELRSESSHDKAERERLTVDLFCFRYRLKHAGPDDMPIAKPEFLISEMETENAGLTREDVLNFTQSPEYAKQLNVFSKFVKQITSRRPKEELKAKGYKEGGLLEKKYHPMTEGDSFLGVKITKEDLNYDGKQNKDLEGYCYKGVTSKSKPSDFLKEFLKKKFVGTEFSYQMPEEVFETMWGIYYTFGGFDVGLALNQKWSQTRSDLTYISKDPNDRSYPMHIYAHKGARYGGWKNANGWLLSMTSKYPNHWVAAHHETEGGRKIKSLQEAQEMVKLYLESYFPLKGIEGAVYPDPREEGQKENFVRFWNPKAYEERYKESEEQKVSVDRVPFDLNEAFEKAKTEFVFECVSEEKKERINTLLNNLKKAKTEEDKDKAQDEVSKMVHGEFNNNFEDLWTNMWDLSVFPDQIEFYMEGLGPEGRALSNGLFQTGANGWDSLRNFMREPIKDGKPIHHEDLFGDGGLWDKFIGSGIGTAKLVNWRHKRWFVPMTRVFLGRVAIQYAPEAGESSVDERIEMANELYERFSAAIEEGEGLKGLEGFKELRDELKPGGNIFKDIVNKKSQVPELLKDSATEASRFKKYRQYVVKEHEERTKQPAPIGWRRYMPLGSGTLSQRRRFRRYFREQTFPEPPLSAKVDTNTTKSGDEKAK